MAIQILRNTGFENELTSYFTQGSVSTNSDTFHGGIKSAQLVSTPTAIAEISQVVFLISPGSPVKLSFYARRFLSEDVKSIANVRAEVNFTNAMGMVIPPSIVIAIRGRDISENGWVCYEGDGVAPAGTLAAQVVVRLEPPESGSSGLLVDDLALVSEITVPAPVLSAPEFPAQPGIPAFSGLPCTPPPTTPLSLAPQGMPAFPGSHLTPPPAQIPPAPQGIPMFPGSPFANPISATPTSPVPPGIPVFPGSSFANLAYPGSPLTNITTEAPDVPKKED